LIGTAAELDGTRRGGVCVRDEDEWHRANGVPVCGLSCRVVLASRQSKGDDVVVEEQFGVSDPAVAHGHADGF